MKSIITGFLCVALLLAAGCATPAARMKKNNTNLLSLDMGMTKQQVMTIMGAPDLNEAYRSLHDKNMVIFFYYTQRQFADGNTTKEECTPVVFENGELIGWGSEFYEIRRKVDITIKQE